MHGKRLPDGTDWTSDAQPGVYAKLNDKGHWWAISPTGEMGSFDSPRWSITEHEDGTITVSPSLFFNAPHGWHGFLEKGFWREHIG